MAAMLDTKERKVQHKGWGAAIIYAGGAEDISQLPINFSRLIILSK